MAWFRHGALWFVWVQVSSFLAGGYITGRLRRRVGDASEHESDVRDGSHGLLAWALGVVVLAIFAAVSIGATATGTAVAVGSRADEIANQSSYYVDRRRLPYRRDSSGERARRVVRRAVGRPPPRGGMVVPALGRWS